MSDSRHVAASHTLMVVYTSTGNLGTVSSNTLNRPARQTITDRGIAIIPLPNRGHSQDWRMNKNNGNNGMETSVGLCAFLECSAYTWGHTHGAMHYNTRQVHIEWHWRKD